MMQNKILHHNYSYCNKQWSWWLWQGPFFCNPTKLSSPPRISKYNFWHQRSPRSKCQTRVVSINALFVPHRISRFLGPANHEMVLEKCLIGKITTNWYMESGRVILVANVDLGVEMRNTVLVVVRAVGVCLSRVDLLAVCFYNFVWSVYN